MQLIEEILDLSKLEANKLELLEEATSVVQFFEYISYVFEIQSSIDDSYLRLYAPDGYSIAAEDDDSGNGLLSKITYTPTVMTSTTTATAR